MPHARFFPSLIRQFAAWVLALAASLMLAGPGFAQAATPQPVRGGPLIGSDKIAVALYADGAPTEGEEWTLALRFTPSASEWHGYWSNPGDAGQGMRLSLNLPPLGVLILRPEEPETL